MPKTGEQLNSPTSFFSSSDCAIFHEWPVFSEDLISPAPYKLLKK